MIDWNNNGRIDPEEIFLTEEILGDERITEEEEKTHKPSGCLLTMLSIPVLIILRGLHL